MIQVLTLTKIAFIAALFSLLFPQPATVQVGAARTDQYLPLLKDKKVALVVNQTSRVGNTHLLDTLLSLKVDVRKVFAPEHGFRGDHSAGAKVTDARDPGTGMPILSLYGKHYKPTAAELADVDVVIFDIQDVGVRFYTYISTLHYIMEACAESGKTCLVLDRPNPNGNYVDGPVLDLKYSSFIGMHPVPLVHGMTVGEYARMINGEGWLAGHAACKLEVVPVGGYTHQSVYNLPVAPSPNLPTQQSIYLYPSLGLFEGTDVSVGRGTPWPFEVIGRPGFKPGDFEFTPVPIPGKAEDPPHKNKLCRGFNLSRFADVYIRPSHQLYLYWLIGFYEESADKTKFFTPFFDKLAGTDQLRKQIESGMKPDEIRAAWQPGLEAFKKIRAKYLLYND